MFMSTVALKATDTYEQHQAIWSLFPGAADRRRDHLFRVERTEGSQSLILLQSATAPAESERAKVINTKPFAPKVVRDACYRFKLTAYPTRCISQGKKVIELQDDNQRVAWLQRKLQGANVTVTSLDTQLVRHKKSFNSRFVTFEGVLQVLDEAAVYQALIMGVGRKKHAGAGLLSLAK